MDALAFDHSYVNALVARENVSSWQSLRDNQIVKQKHDYSCGAASLATILSEFYFDSRTEKEILDLIYDGKSAGASFHDMSIGLKQIGYKGIGYASTFEQLSNLKIPVIVYVKHRKTDHFSVLRGVDEESVWLSDPAIGHVTYSKEQFMRIWATRDGRLAGKFFVVVPEDETKPQNKDYFKKMVSRQSAQAVTNFEKNRLFLKRQ